MEGFDSPCLRPPCRRVDAASSLCPQQLTMCHHRQACEVAADAAWTCLCLRMLNPTLSLSRAHAPGPCLHGLSPGPHTCCKIASCLQCSSGGEIVQAHTAVRVHLMGSVCVCARGLWKGPCVELHIMPGCACWLQPGGNVAEHMYSSVATASVQLAIADSFTATQ